MVQLQKDSKKLEEAGITILAASHDSLDVLKAFGEKQKIGYPLLPDEGSKTIDTYGIRNKDRDVRGDVAGAPTRARTSSIKRRLPARNFSSNGIKCLTRPRHC